MNTFITRFNNDTLTPTWAYNLRTAVRQAYVKMKLNGPADDTDGKIEKLFDRGPFVPLNPTGLVLNVDSKFEMVIYYNAKRLVYLNRALLKSIGITDVREQLYICKSTVSDAPTYAESTRIIAEAVGYDKELKSAIAPVAVAFLRIEEEKERETK